MHSSPIRRAGVQRRHLTEVPESCRRARARVAEWHANQTDSAGTLGRRLDLLRSLSPEMAEAVRIAWNGPAC